ncbi:MAG TPA: hemolysin family protein [Modicisalibacter sp.]|nr:hemolysin family protein [Modicisalibacter sp.]
MLVVNLVILLFLFLLNGFFAMSEIALVTARPAKLQQRADAGSHGAARAIKIKENSTGFLSTVQVGITLIGIVAGAFGAAALSGPVEELLAGLPLVGAYASTLSYVLVVAVITYFSLILGELVPKRFAMTHPEAIAARVVPFMELLSRITAPAVWLLRISTEGLLRLLRVNSEREDEVSEDEVRAMIAEGTRTGVFEPKEREMIEGVLKIADRNVRSVMTPRADTVWLGIHDSATQVLDRIHGSDHSRFPVSGADIDDVKGFVRVKDLLEQFRHDGTVDLEKVVQNVLIVAETMSVLQLLERFRAAGLHMAVVVNGHGSFQGIVTPTDVLTAVGGSLPEGEEHESDAVQRGDGSWLLDASLSIDRVEELVDGLRFPHERHYGSLGGFVLEEHGDLPDVGETLDWGGWCFEVVDLDGRRIDKILASQIESASDASQTSEAPASGEATPGETDDGDRDERR